MLTSAFTMVPFATLRRLSLLAVLLGMPLWGCGAVDGYEETALKKTEISQIDRRHSHSWALARIPGHSTRSFRHDSFVEEVDGKQGIGQRYDVPPGQHTAKVRYRRHAPVGLCNQFSCFDSHVADLTIEFATEAGHEYRIPAERRYGRDWIWVENITSGKVVAGETPHRPTSE